MRICFIGSLELNHFQRMIKWFYSRGHEIHVITFSTYVPQNFELTDINVYKLSVSYPFIIRKLPRKSTWAKIGEVRRIVQKISPDIVHGYFLTEFGFYTAFSGNYPTLLTLTGSDIYINWKSSRVLKYINKLSLEKLDLVVSLSKHMNEELIQVFEVDEQKILTRPEGIDLKIFDLTPQKDVEMKTEPITVVSIRNLKKIYNISHLIKAVPLVIDEYQNIRFMIAGDGPERLNLQELTRKLNVYDKVNFIGTLEHTCIPKLLSSADIYVSTSVSDGASISLFEAMACGCFPIVTDIPANREWINNGVNGFLIPVNDPDSLANKIVNAIRDKELREESRKINYTIVKENADIEKNMEVIERIYFWLKNKQNIRTANCIQEDVKI